MQSTSLKSALAAMAIGGIVSAGAAQAKDPVITYTFPNNIPQAGGVQKAVSGETLKKVYNSDGEIVKLRLTCAFAEALDANNQKFCKTKGTLPPIYWAFHHYAGPHKTCRMQFGQLETLARKNDGDTDIANKVNRKAGKGWETASYCPLVAARDQLFEKYRALGLTAE